MRVNLKRDFLLHAAEKILRSEVNDEAQARVGGRQEMDGGRKLREKSIANSRREKSIANSRREKSIANSRREKSIANSRREKNIANSRREKSIANSRRAKNIANSRREKSVANSRRKGQDEAHHRPPVKESGEKLERRRARATSIVTRDRRESCEEAAVLKIQVFDSQSGEVVITVSTIGFNDARTRVPSRGTWEVRTRCDL